MKNFDDSTYGNAFADVYDDWYANVSDVGATVSTLRDLGGEGLYLELGVGTGRLALALAAAGVRVIGIDTSPAMLERLRANALRLPSGAVDVETGRVETVQGDMIDDLPPGPFDLVVIAYNTIFSLRSRQRQEQLFAAVSSRLVPGGAFVVEAAIPDPQRPPGGTVGVRSLSADRVVLSVDLHDPDAQTVDGQFVEFTESEGVRLRPWSIRYCHPGELDAMAGAAGLTLRHRWSDMSRNPFDESSSTHVSVYSLRAEGYEDPTTARSSRILETP